MEVISRAEARDKGLSRYFTGTPCARAGHITERYTAGESCVICSHEASRRNRKRNPEKRRETARRWIARQGAGLHKKYNRAKLVRKFGQLPPESSVCQACNRPPNGGRGLHLDHDHKTGTARGWLCGSCNPAFGALGDTRGEILERVNRYFDLVEEQRGSRSDAVRVH